MLAIEVQKVDLAVRHSNCYPSFGRMDTNDAKVDIQVGSLPIDVVTVNGKTKDRCQVHFVVYSWVQLV